MSLFGFWMLAALMSLLITGLVALGLWRGARVRRNGNGVGDGVGDGTGGRDRRDLRIYADQLKEIERDTARGLVSPEEAERLRAETARRLLDADRKTRAVTGDSPLPMRELAFGLVALVPLIAAGVYWSQGAYGYGDMPLSLRHSAAAEYRANRPGQVELEAEWAAYPDRPQPPELDAQQQQLLTNINAWLDEHPNDLNALRALVEFQMMTQDFAGAATTWVRILQTQEDEPSIRDLSMLAYSMVTATGGVVSPEADVILTRILQSDPENGMARFYLGQSYMQTGRPDLTFRLWRGLIENEDSQAPWMAQVRAQIEDLARIAGVRYTLPPASAMGARGPSAEDMAAASEMTEEERQNMIGGMVEGLAARLANSGGPAEDWARLIGALGVLGERDRARAIWTEARQVFADRPEELAQIDAAARAQGFTE